MKKFLLTPLKKLQKILKLSKHYLKMPKTKISAKGIEFSEKEKWVIDKLFNEYEGKIARGIKNDFLIDVHVKVHEKDGKRKKFNIHVDVDSAVRFSATSDDGDLARCIHKVMEKILNEIEHKLHVSEQHDKIRKIRKIKRVR